MAEIKTKPTDVSVADFIAAVPDDRKRAEAQELDALFRQVTGWQPVMWGPSIIGYGRCHYRYASGHEGDMAATGFSPRKAEHSFYVVSGSMGDYGDLLGRLGRHRMGKSCLYVRRLGDIDMAVMAALIRRGVQDLGRHYRVTAS